jgi:DNA-binding NarL/FixJ family response regulator
MYRYGVEAVLSTSAALELVASVADGAQLLAEVRRQAPDVVVTDLAMPGVDGLTALRSLAQHHPSVSVLVLSMHDDDRSLVTAVRAGARGYLLKHSDGAELVRAVLAVADGATVYGRTLGERVVRLLAGDPDPFPQLTPRERQVLACLATAQRNAEVARRLGLSEKSVRNLVSQVLVKLQLPDRTAAALAARAAGLGGAPPPTAGV